MDFSVQTVPVAHPSMPYECMYSFPFYTMLFLPPIPWAALPKNKIE